MKVTLLHHSPLWLASNAIRFSHDNHDKGDTTLEWTSDKDGHCYTELQAGEKDKALIARVGNKMKHKSVLEQLVYWFDIDGISRACLQELARHRTARLTVKSSRYTLNELKGEQSFKPRVFPKSETEYCYAYAYERAKLYLVFTDIEIVDNASIDALEKLRLLLLNGASNDIAKYCLPEAFKTRLQWQIDGRNLQNFLASC